MGVSILDQIVSSDDAHLMIPCSRTDFMEAVNVTLLNAEIEVERATITDPVDERLEFGWQGRLGPGMPTALQERAGMQPTPYPAQRHRPLWSRVGDRARRRWLV